MMKMKIVIRKRPQKAHSKLAGAQKNNKTKIVHLNYMSNVWWMYRNLINNYYAITYMIKQEKFLTIKLMAKMK